MIIPKRWIHGFRPDRLCLSPGCPGVPSLPPDRIPRSRRAVETPSPLYTPPPPPPSHTPAFHRSFGDKRTMAEEELKLQEQFQEDEIVRIVRYLRQQVERTPDVGIICGSGLAGLSQVKSKPFLPSILRSILPAAHGSAVLFCIISCSRIISSLSIPWTSPSPLTDTDEPCHDPLQGHPGFPAHHGGRTHERTRLRRNR